MCIILKNNKTELQQENTKNILLHRAVMHLHDAVMHLHDAVMHLHDAVMHLHDAVMHLKRMIQCSYSTKRFMMDHTTNCFWRMLI